MLGPSESANIQELRTGRGLFHKITHFPRHNTCLLAFSMSAWRSDMRSAPPRTNNTIVNTLPILLGAFLFLSPWTLGFTTDETASWNAWLAGVAIVFVA